MLEIWQKNFYEAKHSFHTQWKKTFQTLNGNDSQNSKNQIEKICSLGGNWGRKRSVC